MAKKGEARTFNISVVGLSGTEKEKGNTGVGKSCLCNRFMRPLADDYYTDHISVLSQTDFSGRVVNNDHFLYWGEVTKTSDEGVDFTFNVIEQTEFIDDSSFQPFKSGKTDMYIKRCSATKLSSAEKLMYICKNQLGIEREYEQKLLTDGKISIDGFLCCFDASVVQNRPVEKQVEFVAQIVNSLMKTKKPIILATTKNDEANEHCVREAEKMANRKEYKGNIQIVETSAHENINVELAFIVLAQMIDRTKGKAKLVPFVEAAKARKEVLDVATDAYQSLIKSQVVEYKALWNTVSKKFAQNPDFMHYCDLFGRESAHKMFRRHIKKLQEEHVNRKCHSYLGHLPDTLHDLLPDLSLVSDGDWKVCQNYIQRHPDFDKHFVETPEDIPWQESDHLDTSDSRIPFDLLETTEAETCFKNHVNALQAEQKRVEMKKKFKQLLEETGYVTPGKQYSEVRVLFMGRECFESLTEQDRQDIYDAHQKEITQRAQHNFHELLLEQATLFQQLNPNVQITQDDIKEITSNFQNDSRYKALDRLPGERELLLYNHLGFLQCPMKEHCPSGVSCLENQIETVIQSKVHRPSSWTRNNEWLLEGYLESNQLNLVLLGTEGLADELANEIRAQCDDDEYELDGNMYSLDYRVIDGDVSLPQNSFKTVNFLPHGCFCVYSSPETLEYVRESLEKTLLANLQQDRQPFQGLPIVIVFGVDPNVNEKDLMYLRDQGQHLADSLQCPFIDIPDEDITSGQRFSKIQISLALKCLIESIQHRVGIINIFTHMQDTGLEPDIRILMCMMCGDPFSVEHVLGPLLSHQWCYLSGDKSITLETYLGESKRKVEVVVSSYHGAQTLKDDFFHGYILVYSAKRKAALATLNAFSNNIPPIPMLLLSVTESGGANAFFSNEISHALITEGNALADRLNARFMTTSASFHQQTAMYTPFFKEVWERKADTEAQFEDFNQPDSLETTLERRPPPPPPPMFPRERRDSYGYRRESDQDDSDYETIYPPHISMDGKELVDDDDPSSPLYVDDHVHSPTHENYCYSQENGEHLIKPSQLKKKRGLPADLYRKSYPNTVTLQPARSATEIDRPARPTLAEVYKKTSHSLSMDQSDDMSPPSTTSRYAVKKSKNRERRSKAPSAVPVALGSPLASDSLGRRLQKSSTLPNSSCKAPTDVDEGINLAIGPGGEVWVPNSLYDQSDQQNYDCWKDNAIYMPTRVKKMPPPTKPKPEKPKSSARKSSKEPGRLNLNKFSKVTEVIDRLNIMGHAKQDPQLMRVGMTAAPLATPETVEIGPEYAQVKDILPRHTYDHSTEHVYARVQDALPVGHRPHRIRSRKKTKEYKGRYRKDAACASSSDSERSSLERKHRDDIYSKVQRKPTPHKKTRKKRNSVPRPELADGVPPPIPPFPDDRLPLISPYDHLDKVCSNSPSDDSEGTGDETVPITRKLKNKRSFKLKKKREPGPGVLTLPPNFPVDPDSFSPLYKCKVDPSVDDDNLTECLIPPEYSTVRFGKFMETERIKKEDKKTRDDEKRRLKDEKKKLQGEKQPKHERKTKKKQTSTKVVVPSAILTLDDLAQSEDNLVPLFVEKCVQFIELEGLDSEGIYRVPGNRAHVDQLLAKFDEDPNVSIVELDIPVNAVATALKDFFQKRCPTIIPANYQDELTEASSLPDRTTRLLATREALKNFSSVHYDVLRYFLGHLHRIAENSKANSMDARNLAICWWPTLMNPEVTDLGMFERIRAVLEDIMQTLIENYEFLFYGEEISDGKI